VDSFTNLLSSSTGADFVVTQSKSSTNEASAYATSTANDLAVTTTPDAVLAVNFAGLTAGTYTIEFPATGSFQNFYDADGKTISYSEINATIDVLPASIPEPRSLSLLSIGLSIIVGLHFLKKYKPAQLAYSKGR
jgi:hypothetical protein